MARAFKVFRRIFRFHGFFESLKIALNGIAYLFLYHRNMRIIFLSGVAAFLLGVYFKLRGIELVALCITITLVFMAEMFNTAIELIIDISSRKYHTLIKLVKDISAAVVLIAALNSVGVGFVLFSKRILALFTK
ncbi:MAG: diacylglycerol kinase family protein [Candidatus Omnitrophica bacterium]|jgi:diacylglycerol kinase (ATP)|nr:diacylglycerol kinase family protein [Candidatus Omnitrophota bacterium]